MGYTKIGFLSACRLYYSLRADYIPVSVQVLFRASYSPYAVGCFFKRWQKYVKSLKTPNFFSKNLHKYNKLFENLYKVLV